MAQAESCIEMRKDDCGLSTEHHVATCNMPAPCETRHFWFNDPLTRLMMEADGVSPADLHELLMKVVRARDHHSPGIQRRLLPLSCSL
jgi:hypothetical protein